MDWVVDRGSPTSVADVSTDENLPGDARDDAAIRSAMAVPINPGGGTIGVLYADSVSRTDAFRPDDLALFRALANISAVAPTRTRSVGTAPREANDGAPAMTR